MSADVRDMAADFFKIRVGRNVRRLNKALIISLHKKENCDNCRVVALQDVTYQGISNQDLLNRDHVEQVGRYQGGCKIKRSIIESLL